jgi:hypothetical protein
MENEIIDYIQEYLIKYYSHLMTRDEYTAFRHLDILYKWRHKADDFPGIISAKEKGWISTDPNVLELVKDGRNIFLKNTATRIFNDNRDKIFLNNCPKCGKLARTPRAKQCPHCFHTWHNK